MSIILRIGDLQPEQVSFGFAPAQDALQSLRVLYTPKRHPLHIDWIMRTRKKLTPALKAEIESFRDLWRYGNPLFWDIRENAEHDTFAEQIESLPTNMPINEYIERTLDVTFQAQLLESDLPKGIPSTLDALAEHLPYINEKHPETESFYRRLLADPEKQRERFIQMLTAYWDLCLAPEWEEIETMIVRDIERRARTMYQKSVLHGLLNLSRYLHINLNTRTAIVAYRAHEYDVTFTPDSHLYLAPSYFTWPFLLVSPVLPNALIAYPLMQQQQQGITPVPPERLLQLLKATSDMTRLQILQLIAQKPRSTRELSGLIGITEATISKHLKQLQEAQLVTPKRQSHYVFYHMSREALDELTQGIAGAFDLSHLKFD